MAQRQIGDSNVVGVFVLDRPVDGLNQLAGRSGAIICNDFDVDELGTGVDSIGVGVLIVAADDAGDMGAVAVFVVIHRR